MVFRKGMWVLWNERMMDKPGGGKGSEAEDSGEHESQERCGTVAGKIWTP